MRLAVGLVHYPILDLRRNIVATNITNLDVHDIARACRTYGVERYYLIHPMQDQLMFVHRMLDHWRVGEGREHNPMRHTALTMVHTAENVAAARSDWGVPNELVATHPRTVAGARAVSFHDLRQRLAKEPDDRGVFLIFGTGFGLTEEVMSSADLLLEPIHGGSRDDYRHLSVRSAASICLDRLKGNMLAPTV